jgi:hypothetical protein
MGYRFRQKGQVINHPPGMEVKTLFGIHLHLAEPRIVVVGPRSTPCASQTSRSPQSVPWGAYCSTEQIDILSRHFRYVLILWITIRPVSKRASTSGRH